MSGTSVNALATGANKSTNGGLSEESFGEPVFFEGKKSKMEAAVCD
jgi:hypothetical protein